MKWRNSLAMLKRPYGIRRPLSPSIPESAHLSLNLPCERLLGPAVSRLTLRGLTLSLIVTGGAIRFFSWVWCIKGRSGSRHTSYDAAGTHYLSGFMTTPRSRCNRERGVLFTAFRYPRAGVRALLAAVWCPACGPLEAHQPVLSYLALPYPSRTAVLAASPAMRPEYRQVALPMAPW